MSGFTTSLKPGDMVVTTRVTGFYYEDGQIGNHLAAEEELLLIIRIIDELDDFLSYDYHAQNFCAAQKMLVFSPTLGTGIVYDYKGCFKVVS